MYLVAALKILYNSEFSHERAAAKYTHLPNLTDIPTSNRELHLFHTVHVPIISMLSKKKRISWYNAHDIHKLLHVSAPTCYPQ